MNRPTFYENKKPVRGSGILFYRYNKYGGLMYLLRECKINNGFKYWGDLGGKTDELDSSPIQTAIRECREESNDAFETNTKKLSYILSRAKKHYEPAGKYLIYIVHIKNVLYNVNMFGNTEEKYDIPHKIKWVSEKKCKHIWLHPRLNTLF